MAQLKTNWGTFGIHLDSKTKLYNSKIGYVFLFKNWICFSILFALVVTILPDSTQIDKNCFLQLILTPKEQNLG